MGEVEEKAAHPSPHAHRWTGQAPASRASQPVAGRSQTSLGRLCQEESCQLEPKGKEAGLQKSL